MLMPPWSELPPRLLVVPASEDSRWLQFLGSHPEATVFHHPAWSRVLAETYGYRPVVLAQADTEGAIVAGLPLLEIHRSRRGRRFVALPFTDYCPPLAANATSLAEFTRNLVQWQDVTHGVELAVHGTLAADPGVHQVTRAVRHVLPLGRPSREQLDGFTGSPVHRAIRKAQRQGVETRLTRSADDLETFYQLHLQTRRRLGVPVQPKRFLEILWTHVLEPGLGFVVLAYKAGRPIAGALFLAWNGNLVFKYGASDQHYWELRPNNLVMWTAIDWGCGEGFRHLDMGRTDLDNRGLRDFKTRWGALEIPLVYSYVGTMAPRPVPKAVTRMVAKLIRFAPPAVCRAIGELLYGRVPGMAA
jgi:CelD/BcsL family acetyltransferase involved in cellulose biosynthesis